MSRVVTPERGLSKHLRKAFETESETGGNADARIVITIRAF